MTFPDSNNEIENSQLPPASPVVESMQKSPLLRVDLTWRRLTVWVKEKSIYWWPVKQPYRRKLVLNNVSGIARAGTMTAILGPSGAGKTTLLCALANRLIGEILGDIRINSWPVDGDMQRLSTFIPQENLFIETLTTREHLEFMVALRYPDYSTKKRSLRVNELLKELSLEPNSRISSLSGGERKRLIFASEIVTDPPLLFCDEPTSGLDSHTAHTIISLLEQLAARGRTIICSIHQPSSKVFSAFNHLILLTDGRVAFTGKSQEAQPFFLSLGYQCPQNYNPADFYIQILSPHPEVNDGKIFQKKRIHDICDGFGRSEIGRRLTKLVKFKNNARDLPFYSNQGSDDWLTRTTLFSAEWRTQLYWLTWRSFLDSIRNPSVHLIRTIHKVMTSVLIALCFAGVELNQTGIQDINGSLFIFLTENNFPACYAVLNVFPQEIPIFLREQSNELYRSDTYYVSKVLSLIPGFVMEPLLFTTIAYWIIGLRPDFHAFISTAMILVMTANVACAYGCFLSAAFETVETSTLVMMPINQIIMVSAGFYFNIRTIPIYLQWIKYLSWMMYSNEALVLVQWQGINSIECEGKRSTNVSRPCVRSGREVISHMGFEENNFSLDVIAIASIFLGLHFLGFVCIWIRGRNARQKHPILTVGAAEFNRRARSKSGLSHRLA
ncbi:unnamed protein product [Allacma fusca]|uniref:ABC transporter domain-containing protein n=1 Tax=Allacma fusca TaxID=39272 RepID=A0A8J2LDW1_9HEXA|nr:unnamed protein product [Allacma fusca]